ncbi:hypothetical protein F2Q69_00003293 [Brassica cretica]|uniref:Uncharacterized protein n=1 Tax=Brassica cretica TaxID=69181 RepID=A0A8S9NQK7_BRACR|nr:hypothetical protein F2Q69_00003293 [Brassica cretica]
MVSSDYLTTLRDFYQIPSGVVFRIPNGNESAKNPPEGFFTCYEAFLVYCRMWFPIPGTIVRALRHFGLSISQLSVPALQHWLGVLILSYELGMDLNPGDFEGFWFTRGTGIDGSYRMAPNKVCRGELPPPIPSGVELHLCEQDPSADSYRSFCQVRSSPQQAVLLEFLHCRTDSKSGGAHRSRAVSQPLDVPYGVEPVIDVLPAQRQRIRSRKGKGVSSENVLGNLPLPEWNPGFSPGERSGTSEVPLPIDFFAALLPGFTSHKSLDVESRRKVVAEGSSLINEGMRVFNAALDGSFRKSRISHFKAEEAERELFRFRNEVEEQSRRQAELHSRALVRAERRGKRAIVAEMKRMAALYYCLQGHPAFFARTGLHVRPSQETGLRPCELVCVGRGGSWPASRPAPPVLPNRGFLLPRSWVFRRTRPAERTGFAFFLGGCQHRRPSDRTGRLYPGRCARFLLLRCSR